VGAGRFKLVLIGIALLVAAAVVAPPADALTRRQADSVALRILQPKRSHGLVTVFGTPGKLAAGQTIGEANLFGKDPTPVRLTHPGWLFWEDLFSGALFVHPNVMLVVDDRTGRVVLRRSIGTYPLIGGKDPPFFGAVGARNKLFARIPPKPRSKKHGKHARAAAGGALALPAGSLAHDCLFVIGDRTKANNAPILFGNSMDAIEGEAQKVGLYWREASDLFDLRAKINAATDPSGSVKCTDVMLFIAGHGSPAMNTPIPKNPGFIAPGSPTPEVSLGDDTTIDDSDLSSLLKDFPYSTFKVVIFSCFSGRFVPVVKDIPNLAVIVTSSSATQFSWGYITANYQGANGFAQNSGTVVANPLKDPKQLPGFTSGLIGGFETIIHAPGDVSSTGGGLANILNLDGTRLTTNDFTSVLGWVNTQTLLGPNKPAQRPQPMPPAPTTNAADGATCSGPLQVCTGNGAHCNMGATCNTGVNQTCTDAGTHCDGGGGDCRNSSACTGTGNQCDTGATCGGNNGVCFSGGTCNGSNSQCPVAGGLCTGQQSECDQTAHCTGAMDTCKTGSECDGTGSTCDGPGTTCGANATGSTCTNMASCQANNDTCHTSSSCSGGAANHCYDTGTLCTSGALDNTCTTGSRCTKPPPTAPMPACPPPGSSASLILDTFIPDGVNPLPPSVTDQNGSPIPQSGYMNVCPATSTSVTWNYLNHPEITGTDPIDGSTIPSGRHVYRVTITLTNPNGGGNPTGGPSITNATGRAFWNTGP
jgi:hypothetical protein